MPVLNETGSEIQKLDIRGKVCPMTFVYTKLELEEMKSGEILEIILDFPAALKNVPANCERQKLGTLIEVKALDTDKKTWKLIIKKI